MTPNELLIMRRDAGLSQPELGQAIGYSRQAITKWERGVHAIPLEVVPAIITACTKPPAKVEALTVQDKAAVEQYTKMRQQPPPIGTHAYILKFWSDANFTPSPEAQAAILAAFPDIIQLKGN